MTKKITLALTLFLFQPLYADNAKAAFQFLLENLNARAMGMGGVYAPTAKNSEALNSNPAGLIFSASSELNFSYLGTHSDGQFTSINFSMPYGKIGIASFGVGAGFTYFTAGNIDINYSNGSTDSFDAEKSYIANTAVVAELGRWFSVGLSPKYVSSLLVEQYLARGWALDSGILMVPFPKLLRKKVLFGASVTNLGRPLRYKSQTHELPRTESAGISLNLWRRPGTDSFLVAGQAERTLHEKIRYRAGIEYGLGGNSENTFVIRGGYLFHFDDRDYTLGIGFNEKNVRLDYAFVNGTELGATHRFTLTWNFGKKEIEKESDLKHELLDPLKGLKTEDETNDKTKKELKNYLAN